jgi:double zinc ribbon protein
LPLTDLERFFTQLVRNLAVGDRSRLQAPLPLAEVRTSIVPYRANRRALQLESSEDYELLLLRLCAGEGGFARTEPAESRVEFEMEVGSSNPDLALVERHEKAVLHLDPKAVAKVLNPAPNLAYAPREAATPPTPARQRPKASPRSASPGAQGHRDVVQCPRCGGGLPADRVANFCPQCGQNLTRPRCPQCQAELDAKWRHCVSCGAAIRDAP